MEITSFEAADDFMVTLHMSGLPEGASRDNTTVYITGEPQGNLAINHEAQSIVFKAATETQKGRITVMITLPEEDLDAQSTTDYTPPAQEPEGERPVVNSISQPSAQPGDRRTLRGQNLGKVNGVALFTDAGYKVCTIGVAQDTFVTFTVPLDAFKGRFPVYIRTSSYAALRRTNARLEITKD